MAGFWVKFRFEFVAEAVAGSGSGFEFEFASESEFEFGSAFRVWTDDFFTTPYLTKDSAGAGRHISQPLLV